MSATGASRLHIAEDSEPSKPLGNKPNKAPEYLYKAHGHATAQII